MSINRCHLSFESIFRGALYFYNCLMASNQIRCRHVMKSYNSVQCMRVLAAVVTSKLQLKDLRHHSIVLHAYCLISQKKMILNSFTILWKKRSYLKNHVLLCVFEFISNTIEWCKGTIQLVTTSQNYGIIIIVVYVFGKLIFFASHIIDAVCSHAVC